MAKQNSSSVTTPPGEPKFYTLFESLDILQSNINTLIATVGISIDKPYEKPPEVPHLIEDVETCIAGVQFANQDILSITEFISKARQLIRTA